MSWTCQERGKRVKNRTSANIDNDTQKALGVLSAKTGLTKKDLIRQYVKEALHKEACTN